MGEVYRARDARLQRDVALKILPESAAANPDRQRRFAQEAIAAGALNHPNILIVYDVGVDGGTPYLVSELIDGISLRQEMDRGRIPLRRLLDLAVHISEGLTAAHGAGIVHRDLKPDNVMITRDGRAKILDFGLAKTTEASDVTAPSAMTQTAAGLILGTVPYMSPEQARGATVDFRSDQFSLGLILYEMAAGKHPFRRDSSVQTMSAIIGDEAPALGESHAALPLSLRWTIERLLAKDARERYAHTADLAADLRTIRDRLPEALAAVAGTAAVPRRRTWLPLAVAGAVVAAALALGLSMPAGTGDDLSQYKFTPFATDAGYQGAPAWSPDGKTIAYLAEVDGVLQVFTKSRGSSIRVQVTHQNSDCQTPFWSPDGTRIYYHALAGASDSLWQIGVAGGAPDMLIEGAARAAISPDGQTMAVLRDESGRGSKFSLWFSSPPGAELTQQGRMPHEHASEGVLQYSPDGSKLLMWHGITGPEVGPEPSGFWMMSPPGADGRVVMPALAGSNRALGLFSWLPDNRHIVVVHNYGTPGAHLWMVDTESDAMRPLTLTNGNEGFPSVSPDGRQIAFTSEATDFDLVMLPVDGTQPRVFLSSTRNELDPAWSPTTDDYAYVTDSTGTQEIWLRREGPGNWDRPLVTDALFNDASRTIALGALAFSPDGQRLAYQRASTKDGYKIWISPVAGGSPMRLSADEAYQDAPAWSPDGASIAYTLDRPGNADHALVILPVGGRGAAPALVKADLAPFARAHWSSDGKWILAQAAEGLLLLSPDGKQTRLLSEEPWMAYAWAADGARVYGLRQTDDLHHFLMASIDVRTGEERVVHANLGSIPQANQPIRGFSRSRTGAFATSIARVRSDIWILEGFTAPRPFLERLWPFPRQPSAAGR